MDFFYRLGYVISRIKFDYARGKRDGYAPAPTDKMKQLIELIKDDSERRNFINAIKLHREMFFSSLKEAKDAVDDLYASYGYYRRG